MTWILEKQKNKGCVPIDLKLSYLSWLVYKSSLATLVSFLFPNHKHFFSCFMFLGLFLVIYSINSKECNVLVFNPLSKILLVFAPVEASMNINWWIISEYVETSYK